MPTVCHVDHQPHGAMPRGSVVYDHPRRLRGARNTSWAFARLSIHNEQLIDAIAGQAVESLASHRDVANQKWF